MTSFMDKAKDIAEDVAHKAGDLAHKVEEKIPDSVKEKASDIGEKAGELVEKVKEKLHIGSGDEAPASEAGDTPGEAPTTPSAPSAPTPDSPTYRDGARRSGCRRCHRAIWALSLTTVVRLGAQIGESERRRSRSATTVPRLPGSGIIDCLTVGKADIVAASPRGCASRASEPSATRPPPTTGWASSTAARSWRRPDRPVERAGQHPDDGRPGFVRRCHADCVDALGATGDQRETSVRTASAIWRATLLVTSTASSPTSREPTMPIPSTPSNETLPA